MINTVNAQLPRAICLVFMFVTCYLVVIYIITLQHDRDNSAITEIVRTI